MCHQLASQRDVDFLQISSIGSLAGRLGDFDQFILLYLFMCMWNMLKDRKRGEREREGKSMFYGTTDCLIIPIAASDLTRVPSLDR